MHFRTKFNLKNEDFKPCVDAFSVMLKFAVSYEQRVSDRVGTKFVYPCN